MNFEEFIRPSQPPEQEAETMLEEEVDEVESEPEELDVQKAVVESLAADKAAQDEEISRLKADNESLRTRVSENLKLIAEHESQKSQNEFLKSQISAMCWHEIQREKCLARLPCLNAT